MAKVRQSPDPTPRNKSKRKLQWLTSGSGSSGRNRHLIEAVGSGLYAIVQVISGPLQSVKALGFKVGYGLS
jgi:hypothetical protein